MFSISLYENRAVYEMKYGTAGQAPDGNMAHAHCLLDNSVYKHTLGICNTDRFSTATMVA